MRIDRMLAITVMLLNRERVTAGELAEKFEVSKRTIYRDFDAISMAGIPIVSYHGNGGGFCLMENYKISKQFLSLQDMLSILSALQGLNISLKHNQLDSAMQKIKSLVPREKSNEMDFYMEQIVFDTLPWGGGDKQKNLLQIAYKAIIETRLVKFTYINLKGEKRIRVVEPMTILFKGYGWYLFAYCRSRGDFRFFKFSRMYKLAILNEQFDRKPKSYRELAQPLVNKATRGNMVLKFSPEVRVWVEEYFAGEDVTILDNGELIVKTKKPQDQWLYPMILSFGEYVEVLFPKSLREKIKKSAQKIITKYQT